MDVEPSRAGAPGSRRSPRRRDRHGRGLRGDLIPSHLPGHRTRRERFDDVVTDAAAAVIDRYPRRLEHLQVMVEEVPRTDPAPWEDASVMLGRAAPATREHPAVVVVFRRPIQTRCVADEDQELLVRQVLSEQIASMLGAAPEEIDPGAWTE